MSPASERPHSRPAVARDDAAPAVGASEAESPRTRQDDTQRLSADASPDAHDPSEPAREGPDAAPATEPKPSLDADAAFAAALTAAGVLDALTEDRLAGLSRTITSDNGSSRNFRLTDAYYRAEGDAAESLRRRMADRYFPILASPRQGSRAVTRALEEVNPELTGLLLERIGGDDGPIVFRWGEHVAAVVDEYDEFLETNEIDLRELEAKPTITARAMVRAINRLLARASVDERMVPFFQGPDYEAYLGLTKEQALRLLDEGFMDEDSQQELLDFAGWGAAP